MSASFPRRSHLVERAADAARIAMADDASLARALRPPLAPVEAIPAVVETAVVPPPQNQVAGLLGHNEPAPVTRALLRRAGLIDEAGPAREEIALVREQVLRSVDAMPPAEGRQARLVVITSTHSGEGKSFVALNLAAGIAEGTHRPVILVDAERGSGSITTLLGLGGVPGLAQLNDTGGPEPAGLLRRTEVPGLLFLPHGTAAPSGAQGGGLAAALLHLAGQLLDHIVILDTPACLESSISGLLAAAAGQIALVVEAERTKRAEVEAALDILDACPTLQLLLNRSMLRVSDRFRGTAPRAGDVAVGAHQA
jgi:receptor protein-tyrosine kinase